MAIHNRIEYPVKQIRRWVEDLWTQQEIADELRKTDPRVTCKLVYKVCKKHGIKFPFAKGGGRPGSAHKNWKGGKLISKIGYVKIFCPEHPSCRKTNRRRALKSRGGPYRKQKYVWEHRLVMEQKLGRLLSPREVVHHLNGVRHDNRPENLMLFPSNGAHLKFDLAGKCPQWTEAGKACLQRSGNRKSAIARWRKEHGVPARQPLTTRQKESLAASYPDLF